MLLLIFGIEFVLGLFIGFILSDKKEGLSRHEVKLSTFLFFIASVFFYIEHPTLELILLVHLVLSWFIIIVGVIIGETIKLSLIKNIVRAIKKKDIQIEVGKLVHFAAQLQIMDSPEFRAKVQEQLTTVVGMLDDLQSRLKTTSPNIEYLAKLCDQFTSASIQLKDNKHSGELKELWTNISEELTHLSWDTLNHTEETIKDTLNKAFPTQIVKAAFKSKGE